MAEENDKSKITYEHLAALEDDFDDVDTVILQVRQQYKLTKPLYKKRQSVISRMNHSERFWPLVFEQAPVEIETFIQHSDSAILSEALRGLEVSRFELDTNGDDNTDHTAGEPRSLLIKFEFKENEWFEDKVLEKKFWYRHAKDGWTGLISEPVKIHWKKGKDLSQGLTDDAFALFKAREKAGDMMKKDLPEYKALTKKAESWTGANTSFFTWFGYVSARRFISAEESAKAVKEAAERREKRNKGDLVEEPTVDEESNDEDAEVHPSGEELALAIAEEVWPQATKLFTQAQDMQDEELSDDDFEDGDAENGDTRGDEEEEETIDIRSLVKGKDKGDENGGPPKKKQKK
ncbi:MAG: hypothetical protein M1820_008088 [Bogoriella megaspora]|nr:MAG: hypothetical protein M1820_008088 [Bogoriella megaspora]